MEAKPTILKKILASTKYILSKENLLDPLM